MNFMDRLKLGTHGKMGEIFPKVGTAWKWWVENWKPIVYPIGVIISFYLAYRRLYR